MTEAPPLLRSVSALPPAERARRALGSTRLAVAVLVLLPLLAFAVPALTGHLVLPGDNYDQNYPLRILVGRLLRGGHLPLLDPYSWSGSALLGGWNAGAAYPLTALFAILPATAAWAINQAAVYWAAGLGLFAFLRHQAVHPAAALLAGIVLDVGGSFNIQQEHIGLVAGLGWVPFALLALAKLSTPLTGRSRVAWGALLAACVGLCVLAGEPRAIDNAAIVLAIYGLWRLARSPGQRMAFLAAVAAAGMLGLLVSAAQWLPGAHTVGSSQRSGSGYDLFAAGSLHVGWLSLLAVPSLLGGSGSFGQPSFLSGYSITEVTSYMGLLPLAGALALLGRRWRRPLPDWVIWHGVAVVGILLALGGSTPLGHLLAQIPFYGAQRLQSRNIMITDLALAVLFGHWVDGWLRAPGGRSARLLALVPPAAVVALCVAMIGWGPQVARQLGADPGEASRATMFGPALAGYLGFAALVGVYLLCAHRLRLRWRAGLLAALVIADLAAFVVTVSIRIPKDVAGSPDNVTDAASTAAESVPLSGPAGSIGRTGRFVVYGPQGIGSYDIGGVGDPGLNVPRRRYSAQGYSAIVDGRYASVTGTHAEQGQGHNTISLRAVGDGTLDQLSVSRLLTPPRSLLTPVDADRPADPPSTTVTARRVWQLGQSLRLTAVTVPLAGSGARVGLVRTDGSVRWLPAATARLTAPVAAVGVVLDPGGGSVRAGPPTVTLDGGARLVADQPLQDALARHSWIFDGNLDGYAVFANPTATPPLTARPVGAGTATVQRRTGDRLLPTSARVTSSSGAVVTRAVSAIPGWTATWTPNRGRTRNVAVTRTGLVQTVRTPPGTGTLRWRYDPPGAVTGIGVSLTGLAVFALLGCGLTVERRRRISRGRATDR